jgi:gliding motility-associated-like protein
MLNRNYLFLLQVVLFLCPLNSFSQYILNGDAQKDSCNCYILTEPEVWQGGSVWQSTKIDLGQSFDFNFNVYLGNLDESGADGMVFMLQPLSTSLGAQGEGMGFQGVSPSIGISLDTWQNVNENDPVYDHISIQADGVIKHGNDLAGPVPASATSNNIEDGRWHTFRIKWDASSKTLSTYFDGVLRLSKPIDMVAAIFNNDPMVYWGFSAATGGSYNLQRFCTALNPAFNSSLTDNSSCIGTPIIFEDNSVSFTNIKSYYWDFGDGTRSTLADPPPHFYTTPGTYQISHSITAMDNCESPLNTREVYIGDGPVLSFKVFDTCQSLNPRIDINAKVKVGNVNQWNWQLNGAPFSTDQNPDFTKLSAGNYVLDLQVGTTLGCVSNNYSTNFNLKPAPSIIADVNNGCKGIAVLFNGKQSDNFPAVKNWKWNFGDSSFSDLQNAQHIYPGEGNYQIHLSAEGVNGCSSTVTKDLLINSAHANAGNDTIIARNTLFQLHGSGGVSYFWSPAAGLNNANISDPITKITNDTRFFLTVKNEEGCVDTASVKATVFNGSAIYVPTAFTPNHDGLNDILKPFYVGIKTLYYFTVYNRWGEEVFSTTDMNQGWDGSWKQTVENGSAYVWVLKAVDMLGKMYNLKGSFILLK